MAIVKGVYFANYNDHNGFDEVPCDVDMDKLEVVKFYKATQDRRDVPSGTFVETETIAVNGRDYEAIKFDEWNDVLAGYMDPADYNRENIILFDADALMNAF